jgi:hypothetical protein
MNGIGERVGPNVPEPGAVNGYLSVISPRSMDVWGAFWRRSCGVLDEASESRLDVVMATDLAAVGWYGDGKVFRAAGGR